MRSIDYPFNWIFIEIIYRLQVAVLIGILFHIRWVNGKNGKAKIFAFVGIHNKHVVVVFVILIIYSKPVESSFLFVDYS